MLSSKAPAAGDPLDQLIAKKTAPVSNDPLDQLIANGGAKAAPEKQVTLPPPKKAPRKKSGDLLANMPSDLAGLIVSDVGSRPAPRPVLWGQNKEVETTSELNLEFQSTEREIIDNFDDIPVLSLDDLPPVPAKKKKPEEGSDPEPEGENT